MRTHSSEGGNFQPLGSARLIAILILKSKRNVLFPQLQAPDIDGYFTYIFWHQWKLTNAKNFIKVETLFQVFRSLQNTLGRKSPVTGRVEKL